MEDILIDKIGVKELVVGYDYAFGKGRTGNIEFLKAKGEEKGFPVTVVEAHHERMILSEHISVFLKLLWLAAVLGRAA